jgi:signal transduction histidine kinase
VEVSSERIQGDPPRWRIAVRDNGIGIELEYHDEVFRMFHRLHTSENYPGTGIGLAAVRKAVEHLGGSIRLQSAPGQGSVFFIELDEGKAPSEKP